MLLVEDWRFISEPIDVEPGAIDPAAMAAGEPGVPLRFAWRGRTYEVAELLARSKVIGTDRTHGSGEQYVHGHRFHVRTTTGEEMKLVFDRQARSRRSRWWIRSIARGAPA